LDEVKEDIKEEEDEDNSSYYYAGIYDLIEDSPQKQSPA
jgi:hypothetical protein